MAEDEVDRLKRSLEMAEVKVARLKRSLSETTAELNGKKSKQ